MICDKIFKWHNSSPKEKNLRNKNLWITFSYINILSFNNMTPLNSSLFQELSELEPTTLVFKRLTPGLRVHSCTWVTWHEHSIWNLAFLSSHPASGCLHLALLRPVAECLPSHWEPCYLWISPLLSPPDNILLLHLCCREKARQKVNMPSFFLAKKLRTPFSQVAICFPKRNVLYHYD